MNHPSSSNLVRPTPPTSTLPSLARIQDHSSPQILEALQNLRSLYWPPPPKRMPPKRSIRRLIEDETFPDSGYASAEEEEQYITGGIVVDHLSATHHSVKGAVDHMSDDQATDLKILRSDSFERAFAIKWITGFVSRSDSWIGLSLDDDDSDARTYAVEYAATILSLFAGGEEETAEAVTRRFSFPLHSKHGTPSTALAVELNDAPLSTEDHTAVGLQSWASSILLAERMCMSPAQFGLDTNMRVLELGAGTGLLSIVASRILQHFGHTNATVVATDYHSAVLENLSVNIHTNFPASLPPVAVLPLDWTTPWHSVLLEGSFDVILAADVIYHPEHARLIKGCVKRFLSRPQAGEGGGICWLIMPLRSAGRHGGMDDTVELVFQKTDLDEEDCTLAILERDEVVRRGGVGRADESGYKLFKIGWV